MDTRTECTPDPAFALAMEFDRGLRALYDPTLKYDCSREFRRRHAACQKAERQYCLDSLTRLDQEGLTGEQPADPVQVHLARSRIRLELSELPPAGDDPDSKEDLLLQALADAHASGHPQAIFRALMRLGSFHLERDWYGEDGALENAVWYYKEALVYAHNFLPRYQVPRVLYWLGVTFSRRDETLAQAVFMFDWATRFGASEFGALVEKQKCRLRMGEREGLLQEAQPPADPDLAEVASAIAAMQALGRRRKRMCELARQGVEMARLQKDAGWQSAFEFVLKRECDAT